MLQSPRDITFCPKSLELSQQNAPQGLGDRRSFCCLICIISPLGNVRQVFHPAKTQLGRVGWFPEALGVHYPFTSFCNGILLHRKTSRSLGNRRATALARSILIRAHYAIELCQRSLRRELNGDTTRRERAAPPANAVTSSVMSGSRAA